VPKTVLTKHQADAIEHWLCSYVGGKESLIKHHILNGEWIDETSALNGMPLDTLISALYVGYDIEKSPEERLKDYFNELNPAIDTECITRIAIKKTLEILKMKVCGVNC
jgi:hypothetical protein